MKVPVAAALFLGGSLLFGQQQTKQLTTNVGAPVADNQETMTAGPNGPAVLGDIHTIEKLSAFDRERIPERVVHARGVGAHGVFVSYGDFSQYTKADFLNAANKQTPVFVRFSTVMTSMGAPETLRDPRGFAVKFYTQQGNYDIVGIHVPVFFIRDAIKFPDFVHALKPSPVTNRQDPARMFDFFSLSPESTNMLTYIYSDLGTPANYRQIDGWGVHAFRWVNAEGKAVYVKYHFVSQQGINTLNPRTLDKAIATDYQLATDDLYKQISAGNDPSWELEVQIATPEELAALDFNPFDDTKIWPANLGKIVKLGKMTLNKLPDNYFQETEESAFAPGNLVPGIEPSPDRMLQGRLFSYLDTQRYRIGPNFQQLPINRPFIPVNSYNQNGPMDARETHGEYNYQPNHADVTFVDDHKWDHSPEAVDGTIQQRPISITDNYRQAGALYRSYSKQDQDDLITNLVGDLSQIKNQEIVYQMVSHFYKADVQYGTRLANALHLDVQKVKDYADKLS